MTLLLHWVGGLNFQLLQIMLAHDSICICICWYLHLLLEMWKSKEMLRELFDICKGVLVASAASWSCFLEGMVLQCLVYLNECLIKGYKKNVDFSASAFQTSLNHFLDLWLLPAVPLSFLATAALQAGQKPSQLSTRLPCFWSIPILFIVAIHCSSPLSRQKLHQLLSTCLLKYCCTSHCFTLPNSLLQPIFIMPYYYYIYYNVWKI